MRKFLPALVVVSAIQAPLIAHPIRTQVSVATGFGAPVFTGGLSVGGFGYGGCGLGFNRGYSFASGFDFGGYGYSVPYFSSYRFALPVCYAPILPRVEYVPQLALAPRLSFEEAVIPQAAEAMIPQADVAPVMPQAVVPFQSFSYPAYGFSSAFRSYADVGVSSFAYRRALVAEDVVRQRTVIRERQVVREPVRVVREKVRIRERAGFGTAFGDVNVRLRTGLFGRVRRLDVNAPAGSAVNVIQRGHR